MNIIENFQMFVPPCTACIVGPTGSGKTCFTDTLIKYKDVLFDNMPPKKVMYCYGVYQDLFDTMERKYPFISFHEGLPTEDAIRQFATTGEHNFIIIDDLLQEAKNNLNVEKLFLQLSHHLCISVFFLVQNLFSKHIRTISLNTHYLILFRNFRDSQQINCLGKQLYPKYSKTFLSAYEDATGRPYGYLLINMSPKGHGMLRLMTNIFPDDQPIIVYKIN